MERKYSLVGLILFIVVNSTLAQDEIVLRNGDIIKVKVSEVGTTEIKYKKWENLDGPVYSSAKDDIFMIKYENGSKDVFSEVEKPTKSLPSVATSKEPATIYFIRPKKFAASSPEIIVGTVEPDEVITKVRNGRWYKALYSNYGPIEFVTGVYTINPVHYTFTIEPGNTYYVYCTVLSKGFKVTAELQMLDETTAKGEMSGLKQQVKAK